MLLAIKKKISQLTSRPEQTQIALGLVALVALIFGFWQLKTSLRLPVGLGTGTNEPVAEEELAYVGEDITRLQGQDTDGDGLSDYDELYLYQTSPYLTDTDSDGYDDKTEIDSGNDPICPPEGACTPVIVEPAGSEENLSTAPTADEIRALLRQAGASEEMIASYDDATLLSLYSEVAAEVTPTETSTGAATGSGDLTPEQKELVKQMSGSELRQFLLNGGAEAEVLQGIDDATLKALVWQQLGIE